MTKLLLPLLLAAGVAAFLDPLSVPQFPLKQEDVNSPGATAASSRSSMGHEDAPSTANYSALLFALEVMQTHYFSIAHGVWPDAIDWTAAVMGTQVSSTLSTLSNYVPPSSFSSSSAVNHPSDPKLHAHENLINRYFTQITAFYYGEDDFALRLQAYDDMQWVVLGWLEAIKFVNIHSNFYAEEMMGKEKSRAAGRGEEMSSEGRSRPPYYGKQFIPQFAHRARIFYELASRGWDTSLCGGGMLWSPYTSPYKNAITNQLFIAASVSMYLYFPGDRDGSPFLSQESVEEERHQEEETGARHMIGYKAHDERFLENAIMAYDWLKKSGMRNRWGLYVDGFHVRGWRRGHLGTGKCDVRNEMVYTYNQGVILTGLRGLWEATGDKKYLIDGHDLIQSVISATGWPDKDSRAWAGLGRGGVLEDVCDVGGYCDQNAQTFKGIFFHHFSTFCTELPEGEDAKRPRLRHSDVHLLHKKQCDGYSDWVVWNSEAALATRDKEGRFGAWWIRPRLDQGLDTPPSEGTDYRNDGVPEDDVWRLRDENGGFLDPLKKPEARPTARRWHKPVFADDINDRGRGRTIETQAGGLAVVRAAWRSLRQSDAKGAE